MTLLRKPVRRAAGRHRRSGRRRRTARGGRGQRVGPALAALALAAAGTPAPALEVDVVDAEGAAVAGAEVTLWQRVSAEEHRLAGAARTGPGGRAEIGAEARSGDAVVVSAPSLVRRVLEVPEGFGGRLRVRLERGVTRVLAVADERGRPERQVRWLLLPREGVPLERWALHRTVGIAGAGAPASARDLAFLLAGLRAEASTSENGSHHLRGLDPSASYRLLLSAPGYGVEIVDIAPPHEVAVQVRLDRRRCREARVTGPGGRPIAGAFAAPLAAFVEGPLAPLWPAGRSGPDGAITIGCPRTFLGGPFARIVAAPGAAPRLLPGGAMPPRIELSAGAVVEAEVVDREGEPVGSCRAELAVSGFTRRGECGADGRLRFERLPAGFCRLEVRVGGEGSPPVTLAFPLQEAEQKKIALGPACFMDLAVRREGEPWAGAAVALSGWDGKKPFIASRGETDREGVARLAVPGDAGDLTLHVFDDEEGIIASRRLPEKGFIDRILALLRSSPEIPAAEVEFEGWWLDGRVLDEDTEEPVAHRIVEARSGMGIGWPLRIDEGDPLFVGALGGTFMLYHLTRGAVSQTGGDDRGRFRIFVPRGAHSLGVFGPPIRAGAPRAERHYADAEVALPPGPGRTPFVVRLRAASRLRVEVTDVQGEALADCFVSWEPERSGIGINSEVVGCDASDELDVPPDVPLLVSAKARGRAPAVVGPIVVPRGESREVELLLGPGGRLRLRGPVPLREGRRYLPAGTLVDGAGRDWTYRLDATIGPDGNEVLFEDVPAGRWRIRLGDVTRTVRLEAGAELVVALERGD